MGGTEYMQWVLWRASDQSLRDSSLQRNIFVLGTGAVMDATGGKFGGGAFHGNGASTAYASTDHRAGQRFAASGDFYVSAWVNLDGTTANGYQVVMGKGSSGSQQFYFGFNGALTVLHFRHTTDGGGSTDAGVSVGVTITPGTWYHVAASRSGGTVRLFLNGTLLTSGTLTSTYVNSNAPLTVGGYAVSGFTYPFKGLINDAQLVVGEAIHTSSFTPETAYITPYSLTVFKRGLNFRKVPGATRPIGSFAQLTTGRRRTRDVYYFGAYKVVGTVKKFDTPTNVPLKRKVILFREPEMRPIALTWSDPVTGAYEFLNVTNAYKYTVVAFDYQNYYRAVVGDNQTAEPM